jgi:5-methylcytosine-specific restriction endonuclease McrA
MQGAAVLVLNADLGPLHRVSLRHAIRMLCRGVAEIHESEPEIQFGRWQLPKSVKLLKYVVTKWRYTSGPAWSRAGVIRRDKGLCGYCGDPSGKTVDHILPTSRGGKNTWVNTVACCDSCNQRKGNYTLVEAKMKLLFKPTAPLWSDLNK